MDLVETQRPNSGQQIGIEGDCRGRSGTIVINESGEEKDDKMNKHKRAVAKSQPNTSSESIVVEERKEQTKEIKEKREERKWPQTALRHCAPRPSFENGHLRHTAEKRKTNAAMAEAAKTAATPAAAAGAKTTSEARNFSRSMNVTRRNGSIPGERESGEKSQVSEEKSTTSKSGRRGKNLPDFSW